MTTSITLPPASTGVADARPPRRRTDAPFRGARLVCNVLAVLAAVGVWHLLATAKAVDIALPTPAGAARGWWHIVTTSERQQLFTTLARVGVGFAIGSIAGLLLGLVLGLLRPVRAVLEPYIHFLRSITPVAWIVPATIWLGVGTKSLLFIVVYATVFPVVINTVAGLSEVPENKIRMARMFGARRARIVASVVLPAAVPYVLTGMRLALGYAFMSVVAAEMIAGSDGLGYLIFNARITYDTTTMFGGIVLLGMAGFAGDRVFVLLRNSLGRRFYAGQVTQ